MDTNESAYTGDLNISDWFEVYISVYIVLSMIEDIQFGILRTHDDFNEHKQIGHCIHKIECVKIVLCDNNDSCTKGVNNNVFIKLSLSGDRHGIWCTLWFDAGNLKLRPLYEDRCRDP